MSGAGGAAAKSKRTEVTLILRKNDFATARRPDYDVVERSDDAGERVVGRIYFGAGADGKQWLWAIAGFGSRLAETREAAMAAFKAEWARLCRHE
jgi:hypothetical protein